MYSCLFLIQLGIILGLLFFVIPGIYLSISWSMALFLIIDKDINPVDALKL
ncbi:MAG: hypothetical protein KatS3mg129_0036 [Leptospiraceae bacterium]|nr:MAG: hypothetical protein KatS3mg129_0036 [Leptospiraceae bacterium]